MKTNRNDKIETIKIKIEQNEQIRDKAIEMSRILKDKTAKEQCETQIKESEKYVAYLYEELQQLNNAGLTETESSISDSSNSSSNTSRRQSIFKRMSVPVQSIDKITAEEGVVSSVGTPLTSHSHELKKRNDNTRRTSLDLLKANNPINRDRITLMLHELENKLHILQRAQSDARKVSTTINASTDRRWHADAHKKRIDYQEKIILLKKAIQKYRNLNIDDFGSAERLRPSVGRTTTLVPASGKLRLKVLEARELTHAPSHTFPTTQTYVTAKVTGQRECKTKMSRNDTWMDTFETDANKAAEIEIVIYDAAGDRNLPIGMLWLRMIDIAEDLRQLKRKHNKSNNNTNNNNNNVMDTIDSETESSYSDTSSSIVSTTDGFTEWFNVEPFGKLHLHLNFVRKEAKRTGPINKLRRAGAFKEREGQVRYVNGHTFISGRFYQVMRCAVCKDFMVYMTYKCSACHMACHKDCCIRMAARCTSGELPAQNDEEEEFKYNIPHRFENITLIGTNWCSHCGLILPLGYRGAKKCTECGIICHSSCKVFVPDFCGITLDRAYEMWKQYKTTNDRRRSSQLDKIFVRLQMGGCQQGTFAEGVQALMHGEMSRDKALVGSDIQSPITTSTIEHQRPNSQISSYRMSTPMHVNQRTTLEDFNFLAVLGRGNFGKVMLAENKYTCELYAIKALLKKAIIENDDMKSILAEKDVFIGANREKHPFLVGLHSTYMTASRVFFVMEYVPGGDLMLHIQGSRFSEPRSRFYCAEVLLALEHLHSKGIIYRDLKLDNIVLGADGHIKLADYGLCKSGIRNENDTTTTYCGTPEFMAPEILKDTRYTRAVDWWALGVLLYEMLVGEAPFKADTESELFEAIINDELECPIFLTRDAQSICHALLQKDPLQRLGSGPQGSIEIRSHVFFEGVKWKDLLAKRIKAPFIPNIKSRADTSNFDQQFTSQFPVLTPITTILSPTQQQNFDSFPYISEWALNDTPATLLSSIPVTP